MLVTSSVLRFAFLSAAVALLPSALAPAAFADTVTASFYGPGVQSSPASTFTENFDNAVPSGGVLTTNFNGSALTGTYTGGFIVRTPDIYGGAGGTGKYITTYTGYSLTLSSSVNYFGLWFSALDPGNQLSFYNGSTLLYTFTPANFVDLVGACPSNSGFCGNPNSGANSGQQYAFLNFFDSDGSFNRVDFTEINGTGGGLESDNHTVGNLTVPPGGTTIPNPPPVTSPVPEPSTLLLLGTGSIGLATGLRRRFRRS